MGSVDSGDVEVGLDDPEATVEAVEDRLDRERRRTVDELEAFRDFRGRVRELSPAAAHTGPPAAAAVGNGTGADPADVRLAYRETVMSVPHYERAYGDTYEQSVREEFGPDVGTALVRASTFDRRHKTALLSAVRSCERERERFVDLLVAERDSIERAAETLIPLADQLAAFDEMDFAAEPPPALDAYRARLGVLADRAETVAADRQADLDEVSARFDLPNDRPEVTAYFYQDFPATHPVLALAAEAGTRASALRRRVELSLAGVEMP